MRHTITIALLVFIASAVVADDTPPVVTPNVSGTLGTNGWYVSDVAVSWTVTDDESAIQSTSGCEAQLLTQDDTARTYTCVAISEGGATTVSQTISRDTTAPVVSYTNNLGTYQVSDSIQLFCNTSDATSGIASSDCANFTADALDLIGVNTVSATATDNAGNIGTGSATFEVVVTAPGIAVLVDRYVTKASVARNLKRDLLAGKIDAFNRTVTRHTGRSITAADAETLLRLAAML